jgi:DNA-binding MarR family transcriptional regulator
MSDDKENIDVTEQSRLFNRAVVRYDFVEAYNQYMKIARDYGTGETINMVEVHTLTLIEEHPGIMAKDVASMWNRTKGAVSQTLAKLEKRGLIERRKENGNSKNVHIYVTHEGKKLSETHRAYDLKQLIWADKELLKDFDQNEVAVFYRVMEKYTALMYRMSKE